MTTSLLLGAALFVLGLALGLWLERRRGRSPDLDAALAPLDGALDRVQAQLTAMERERATAHGVLHEQVRSMSEQSAELRRETGALVAALRAPVVRGRWGELQLRRLVEAAGMVAHCDFLEQPTAASDDGRLRPDLVVRLTGERSIVVDAKVPFEGYVVALDAADEAEQRRLLRAHARHLRNHCDALAAKQYAGVFAPAPEFVVLFVPSDGFLQTALEHDPALLEHAFDRDVVIASPSTLIALLRTVAYTWRQEGVAENAQEVLALGRELHHRLATVTRHVGQLGAALTTAVGRYNDTVGSLERSVLVSARRFVDLDVGRRPLTPPRPVDRPVRAVRTTDAHDPAPDHEADVSTFRRA